MCKSTSLSSMHKSTSPLYLNMLKSIFLKRCVKFCHEICLVLWVEAKKRQILLLLPVATHFVDLLAAVTAPRRQTALPGPLTPTLQEWYKWCSVFCLKWVRLQQGVKAGFFLFSSVYVLAHRRHICCNVFRLPLELCNFSPFHFKRERTPITQTEYKGRFRTESTTIRNMTLFALIKIL